MTDMDVPATARTLGVSERTVRRWLKAGRITGYRVGSRIRIPEHALREVAEAYDETDGRGASRAGGQTGDPLTAFLFGRDAQRERARAAARDIDDIRRRHSRPAATSDDSAEALLRQERDERDAGGEGIVGRDRP